MQREEGRIKIPAVSYATVKKDAVDACESASDVMQRGDETVIAVTEFATLTFTDKKNIVQWKVREGEDVSDAAHESAVAVAFFESLQIVCWIRGTGGAIHGWDDDGKYLVEEFKSPESGTQRFSNKVYNG